MNKKSIAAVVGLVAGIAFASTAMAATFSTTLKLGSTGQSVKDLQVILNSDSATQVAASGVGSAGMETTYFGNLTKAAVIKFQNKYASEILAPVGLTSGTGVVGAMTRAKLNAMGAVTTTTTTPSTTTSTTATTTTGTDLAVTLSSDSPATGGAIVAGQAIADLAHFTFKNNTSGEAKVTKVTLNRTGISNDSALPNVYLYDGVKRVSDSASVSSGVISFNDAAGLFTVGAGASKNISVRADIDASVAGQIVGVSLASVTSTVTASGSFPVAGGFLSVASATLGTLAFNTSTTPSATTVDPQTDYTVWQNTVTVGTHALNLKSMSFRNIGSVATGDVKNFRLYADGALLSTVENTDSNGYMTFDISASPKRLETGSRILKVVADIVGGSTRTFQVSLRTAGDISAYDVDLGQPVLATGNDSSTTGTFAARSATSATINGGSITVTKSTNSPSSNIAVGSTNVKLASFDLRASGENVKIDNLDIQAGTSISNGGLDNAKVFFNGVQVGSTKDLTETGGAADEINFTFGSSLIVNAGTTGTLEIYADAKTSTSTNLLNNETILVSVGINSANAQGTVSLSTITTNAADVDANTITVTSSTLTATKYSGYGNQTMVAGRNNAKIGAFVLSTGASEGANVDTITVALSTAEAASLSNVMLKDNASGAQIGTTKGTPGTSNAFTMNVAIPASGSKTIDIYADILPNINVGPIDAAVTASGTGTLGNSVTASSVTLQTITVSTGSLTLAAAAGDPTSANVIAGTTETKVGQFRFTAANDSYTVQELKVKVTNNAATSTTGVTLKYKNSAGTTQSVTMPVVTGTEANATATFTGLSLYVPNDGSDALLDVYVGIPTIASGASSGAAINVTVDYNEGFKAVNSAGTASTSVGSADKSSAGTFYVRKTIPTITKTSSGVTTPTTGQALYKFTITADATSAVEIKKISLAVATTTMNVAALSLYEVGNSTAINTTAVEVNSSGNAVFYAGESTNDTVISVAAGESKNFEVKGTVTNWGAAGDNLTISFTEDTSAGLTATSASHAGNQVWSDRSATSHTTITADWINGYLVKDMSNDVQSYSF